MCETLGIDVDYRTPSVLYEEVSVPASVDNQQFIDFLLEKGISFSNKSKYRLARSHGHTGGIVGRIPDIVVWPASEDQVVEVSEGNN
ncbi:unnamed protein product [Gongylonema pulchrum]|uniref:Alkylglycerone-phosphate synthase n=1 Tax=Gongylonema pulchrum TaxID=637853 RepID=A0A183EUV9_9BILA|nr:unnamed protein product [Gongylonema pulchrum]